MLELHRSAHAQRLLRPAANVLLLCYDLASQRHSALDTFLDSGHELNRSLNEHSQTR